MPSKPRSDAEMLAALKRAKENVPEGFTLMHMERDVKTGAIYAVYEVK